MSNEISDVNYQRIYDNALARINTLKTKEVNGSKPDDIQAAVMWADEAGQSDADSLHISLSDLKKLRRAVGDIIQRGQGGGAVGVLKAFNIKTIPQQPEEKKDDPTKNPSNTMPAPGSAPFPPPPETKAEAADDNKGSAVASGVLKEEIIHSEPLLRPEFIQVQTIEEETPEEELKEDKIYEAFSNNAFTEFQVGGNTQFVHKQPAWLNIDKYSIGSAMPIFEPVEKQFRVWDMLPFDRLPNNLKVQRLQKSNPRPNFDSPQADSDVFGVDPQYIYQNPPQASIDPLFNDVHTFEYVSIAGMN